MRISELRKINQQGFDHIMLAVVCVVICAVIGTALLVVSHAQTTQWKGLLEIGKSKSGTCLTTTGTSNSSTIVLDPCSSSYNSKQAWELNIVKETDAGTSSQLTYYNIASVANTKECINDWQENKTNGWQLRLYTCNATTPNEWVWSYRANLLGAGVNQHEFLNMYAEKCLDDYQDSKKSGDKVDLYTCSTNASAPSQEWFEDTAP